MSIAREPHRQHGTPQGGLYEWWYLHISDGAWRINVVIHRTDIFGESRRPYISMSLVSPGGERRYHRLDLEENALSYTDSRLHVQPAIFEEGEESVDLDVRFPDGTRLAGEVRRLAPTLVLSDGVLASNGASGRTSSWVAMIPHGQASAVLTTDGTPFEVEGPAYMDHQWGELPLAAFVEEWVWLHLANEDTAVILFLIRTQDGELIERTACYRQGLRSEGTRVLISGLPALWRSIADARGADLEISLISANERRSLVLAARPEDLMRERIDEPHSGFEATYLRWSVEAQSEPALGELLRGVAEYLGIER